MARHRQARLALAALVVVVATTAIAAACGGGSESAPAVTSPTPDASPSPTTTPTPTPEPTAPPTPVTTSTPTPIAPTPTSTPAPPTPSPPAPPPPPPTVPPGGGPATVVSRGDTSRPVVALTFDAGSDVGYTAQILDTLAARGVPASFGLTGAWVDANPALVARMAAEGHVLVNHTYDHPSFTGFSTGTTPLTRQQRWDQLARADAAIVAASGRSSVPWFRPPYGDRDASVDADVGAAGYGYVAMWTVDSLGWRGLSADEIVARCLERAEPGAIYLFHVGSQSADGPALPAIIDGLQARGYGFATLDGILLRS